MKLLRNTTLAVMGVLAGSSCSMRPEAEAEAAMAKAKAEVVQKATEERRWNLEQSRQVLALCLDIARFEKQWNNYANWSFDRASGTCTVSYKKSPAEKTSPAECVSAFLPNGAKGASPEDREMYRECVSTFFERTWSVGNIDPADPLGIREKK